MLPLNGALVTTPGQVVSGLAPATPYHYRVRSSDGSANLAVSGDFTFTTAAPDTTPPAISGVAANGVTNTAATIAWTTDEGASSQVDYGLTTAYGASTPLDPALTTAHAQPIAGLSANTQYHYHVRSTDGAGNPATSGDLPFTTTNTPPLN